VRAGLVSDLLPDRRFDLRHHRYLPGPAGPPVDRATDGPATFRDATGTTDPMWEQCWWDVVPGALDWHEPLARIEMGDGPDGPWLPAVAHGRRADDQGCGVEIVHLGPGERGHRYAVRWWDPAFRAGREHRAVLAANTGRSELAGGPFDRPATARSGRDHPPAAGPTADLPRSRAGFAARLTCPRRDSNTGPTA